MDISYKQLERYQQQYDKNSKYKVLQGVLRSSKMVDVAANPNSLRELPFSFNVSLPETTQPLDQKNSGRCWIFAALNVLRHKLIQHYKLPSNFELSEAYIARCDKLERCNACLEILYEFAKKKITNQSIEYAFLIPRLLEDGGTWGMFVNVIKKYGIVPKDIYPDNAQATTTYAVNSVISQIVMQSSALITSDISHNEFMKIKADVLEKCFKVINTCYGNVPKKFKWTYKEKITEKEYTPMSFYNKIVKRVVDVSKFVSICNFPPEQYHTTLCVEYIQNVLDQKDSVRYKDSNRYYNLPKDDFKAAIAKTIANGNAVWFAAEWGKHYYLDIHTVLDEKSSNVSEFFDIDLHTTKKQGLETQSTIPVHAMVFVGCNVTNKKPLTINRWKVENSHGNKTKTQGFITMSDSWMNDYVIVAAVPRNCLPKHLLKRMSEKHEVKWLPMHSVLGTFAK